LPSLKVNSNRYFTNRLDYQIEKKINEEDVKVLLPNEGFDIFNNLLSSNFNFLSYFTSDAFTQVKHSFSVSNNSYSSCSFCSIFINDISTLICCNSCKNNFHKKCAKPSYIPKHKPWLCSFCKN